MGKGLFGEHFHASAPPSLFCGCLEGAVMDHALLEESVSTYT